ncbi:MAG: hypothetical protein ABH986_02985 [archaeon]
MKKLFLITIIGLVILFSGCTQTNPNQEQKESVKEILISNVCKETLCAPTYLFECENGFASSDSCKDSFSFGYDTQGNIISQCGGYIGGCQIKTDYDIGNCNTKKNLCD